ncbi:GMC family oxidoreductase N-terminal domain-containing protein, partial [Streptomyces prunicolor]
MKGVSARKVGCLSAPAGVRLVGDADRSDQPGQVRWRARREVVLCAGAVDSPRLLLHSGIGPRKGRRRHHEP